MSNIKSELNTQELLFRKIGQNLKRQGIAQILDTIPFVHFFGNAWLLALKIKLGAIFKRAGTTLNSVDLVAAGEKMRASAICYLPVIIIYNIRFFFILNSSIILLQITPETDSSFTYFYYFADIFRLSIILFIFRTFLLIYEYMSFKEIKFFFIYQLPASSSTKQKALDNTNSVMFDICLAFVLSKLIAEIIITSYPLWLLGLKSLLLMPWLWLLLAGVAVAGYAYFNLGKTFIALSKKSESLISRDVVAGVPVGPPSLYTNLALTHRTRVVSNKVAEVLITLMILEILVLLILPFYFVYNETRSEIHMVSYWIYFYNQLILKVNFEVFWFVYLSFLFFINPVVTAVAIFEEIKLYKKYRGYNFIPLKTAFFVHIYINLGYVLIMGYFDFILSIIGRPPLIHTFIFPQPTPLTILIFILLVVVKLKAKRTKQFFESSHDKSNYMDV
ncbi:MAG: hypothetical protein ACTSRA_19990 [Promethearchaeota archaeon]